MNDDNEPGASPVAPAIILVEPQLGENIGMVARAMANFGLSELRLVSPRDGWPSEKARAAASRADHVVDGAVVFDDLRSALADLNFVYATTARERDGFKQVRGPVEAGRVLRVRARGGQKTGIMFGRERFGLYNEEVALSDAIVTLPVEAAFASLNIAQAVLIMAYEWRRQSDLGKQLLFTETVAEPATKGELLKLFEHLEQSLEDAGFFTAPDKRPTIVNNIRAMLSRGTFSGQEVRTLHGVISSIERRHERPKKNRPNTGQDGEPI